MKTRPIAAFICLLPLASCDNEEKPKAEAPKNPVSEDLMARDTPILPLKEGDTWTYKVRVEISPGVTSEGSAAVEVDHEMERVYLGKMKIGEREPEVDVFEVTRPSVPVERELVEIFDNRIMMRGSAMPSEGDDKVQWLETPVLFVFAGMRPGQEVTKLSVQEGARQREIQVVARESVTVPAGEFSAIRLLMTGTDGLFNLRRTIWFSPKNGIVKEEKARYSEEKFLFRETTELIRTTVGGK